jgi:hypothetical protein
MNDADIIEQTNPLFKEIIVFRPLTNSSHLLRYANNTWIPDDGEPDLAFVDLNNSLAYYVQLPNYKNVIWSWFDLELTKKVVGNDFSKIEYRKGWHTMTVDNTDEDDEKYHWFSWDIEKEHPNGIASRHAMDKCCSLHHVAQGRAVYIFCEDKISLFKWVKSTMQLISPPQNPICHLCLNDGLGHKTEIFHSMYTDALGAKEHEQEIKDKAESDMLDAEYNLEKIEEHLAEYKKHSLYNPEWDKE